MHGCVCVIEHDWGGGGSSVVERKWGKEVEERKLGPTEEFGLHVLYFLPKLNLAVRVRLLLQATVRDIEV